MGDAGLSVNEALYNFDLIKFYHNFLNLITDIQRDDGALSDIVPGNSYPADPNWGTALVTITWQVYSHYNDTQTLKTYYNNIVAYVEYLENVYNQTGLANFFGHFGDWVPPTPYLQTNAHLISSFAFLHDVYILINMSQILEETNHTMIYTALYEKLAKEFHQVFFNTSKQFYADGMQAAQILALALPNVTPTNIRETVLNHLVSDINEKDIHVTTGIVSTAQLFPLLSDNGHHDLALELVSSTTYPSYGYMFNNPYENATTLWETWDTPVPGPGLSSRNHIMFGSVGAWFYSHLAGISFSSNIITIRPRMASEQKKHLMTKLHCQLSTLYGIIQVSYTRDENETISNSILLRITVPSNAQARVIFEPLFIGAQCKTLKESGKIIWLSDLDIGNVEGFKIEKDSRNDLITVYLGSGEYEFHALWQ